MYTIITGANKGIGKAIAIRFAAAGHHLLLCARDVALLEATTKEINTAYPAVDVRFKGADLSKKEEVISFANWCLQQGTPGILVNNAGIYLPGAAMDEADGFLEMMMNINLYGPYHLTRKLVPAMIKNGSGHIFNICSIAALQAYEGGGSYSISKFALNGLSQNLRHELRKTGIKVTAVFPGAVMTDTWGDFDNSGQRIMEAEDVAIMVLAASRLSKQAVVEEIVLRPQLGDL